VQEMTNSAVSINTKILFIDFSSPFA